MMQLFEGWFGATLGPVLAVITLLAVVGLMFAVLWFIYRIATRPRDASGKRSRQARLAVTDAAAIDGRRRLVLVRRDDVEHLIMIGGPTDIVIEDDIRRLAAARPRAAVDAEQARQMPVAQPTQRPSESDSGTAHPSPASHNPARVAPTRQPAKSTLATPAPAKISTAGAAAGNAGQAPVGTGATHGPSTTPKPGLAMPDNISQVRKAAVPGSMAGDALQPLPVPRPRSQSLPDASVPDTKVANSK